MKQIDVMWKALRRINKKLDTVQLKVAEAVAPPEPASRETPFVFSEKFIFSPGEPDPITGLLTHPDLEVQEGTLVSSAGVVTRITRLNYIAYFRFAQPQPNTPTPFVIIERAMRNTSRGLVFGLQGGQSATTNIDEFNLGLFDFEWNISIGSTEREYARIYGDVFRGFCARDSLSNFEDGDSLLVGEDHPLILGSNEFLTFKIRPTLYNFFMNLNPQVASNPRYVVTINALGYRSASDV